MPRYTATWSLNLVPDPGEEEHESIYESAPIEIKGENFSAAAKVEQMTELDAQMPVPMDDEAGWTVLFAFLHINLIPDTDTLKAAARPSLPSARRLNPMNRYYSLPLTLCVCLFIGCGSINENPPAQLISTVPAEGDTIGIKLKLCHNSATALVNNNVDTNPNPRSYKMAKKRQTRLLKSHQRLKLEKHHKHQLTPTI